MMKFLVLLDFLPPFAVRISLQLQCHATQQTTSRSQSWNVTRLAGGLLYIIVRSITVFRKEIYNSSTVSQL